MKRQTALPAAWAFIAAAILGGCATSIPIQVQRLPNLDTRGVRRISIEPFSAAYDNSLQRYAATNLTETVTTSVYSMNHFEVISYQEITRLRWSYENIGDHVDAILSGQVVSLDMKNTSAERTRKDKEGNVINYTVYQREVSMSFNYRLTRARDGSIIGIVTKTDRRSDSKEDRSRLATAESMIDSIISRNLTNLNRDLMPYTVTEYRKLLKIVSPDKDVKRRGKDAMALAKRGNYLLAEEAFLDIYRDAYSFEAAYNVGLLIEARGDLNGAAAFLDRVASEFGNPQASSEAARIRRRMGDAEAVANYMETRNQRDTVVALMINAIISHLPNNARVALVNKSESNRDIADYVTNSITAGLQSNNVIIVDRSNRALLEAERNYQLMGYVSDDELVSIGREVGVNTFVVLAVSGTGSMRRLSLQMIDLERSTVIYQSPQTDDMRL